MESIPKTDVYTIIPNRYDELNIRNNTEENKAANDGLWTTQRFVTQYMKNEDVRGVLAEHGLGSGKTRVGLLLGETFGDRHKVVLLPARLKSNFIGELMRFGRPEFRLPENYLSMTSVERKPIYDRLIALINKEYTFISYNSLNVVRDLKYVGSLSGKVLIVDEVHTLLARIVSPQAKIGHQIYKIIMESTDLKILFLSGTPAISDPFELAVMFNMLKGPIWHEGTKYTLFPEDYRLFTDLFVDRVNNKIINAKVFQDRITGMVSYYAGNADPALMPREMPMELRNVRMSAYQWRVYVQNRKIELDQERRDKYSTKSFTYSELKRPERKASSTYKQGSVQSSNFVAPDYIKMPTKIELIGKSKTEIKAMKAKAMAGVKQEDLQLPMLREYSCKFADLLEEIARRPNQLIFIYSAMDVMGVSMFAKVLDANGWTRFRGKSTHVVTEEEEVEKMLRETDPSTPQGGGARGGAHAGARGRRRTRRGGATRPMYGLINGETSEEEKDQIKEIFTNPKNAHGSDMQIVLGTKVIAEGIDFKNLRLIVLLEGQWKRIRVKQVIGRGVRLNSHLTLPMEERVVDVVMYQAIEPESVDLPEVLVGDDTTVDVQLYNKSMTEGKLLDSFARVRWDAAADCQLNHSENIKINPEIQCRKCLATGLRIFIPDVRQHILHGTRCETEKMVQLQKTVVKGIEYGIDEKGRLYSYDQSRSAWVLDKKMNMKMAAKAEH